MSGNDNLIFLDKYREHISCPAKCLNCKYEWIAVSLIGTSFLECPRCETHLGVFSFPLIRDTPHWICACGNDLFALTPDGFYCPKCGKPLIF